MLQSGRAFGAYRPLLHFRGCSSLAAGQLDASATSLRESDRNGLLGGSRTVLSLPDVVDFFANEFACLICRAWITPFGVVTPASDCKMHGDRMCCSPEARAR